MNAELARAIDIIEGADLEGEGQEVLRSQLLDFCHSHDDALYRSCLTGHLTGSALIVDPQTSRTLLIHHRKLERWLQPGGHVDGNGDLGAAALREAEEETGIAGLELLRPAIDIDVHSIPARGDEPAHLHLDVRFAVVAPPDAVVKINHESLDARWVGADDPDGLVTSDELHRLIRRGLAVVNKR